MTHALAPPLRSSTRFRWVALGFTSFLALGLVMAVLVYDRFVAYEPTAARHVPAHATAVVRFDLTHVMFYEPYRRSIAPLADRLYADSSGSSRTERLEARGVRLAGDVRELVLAVGPTTGDWVLVLGGRLPSSGLASTVAEILREDGYRVEPTENVFDVPDLGFVFAEADDGAFLLASGRSGLSAALPRGTVRAELMEGSGGLWLRDSLLLPPAVQALRGSFRAGSVVLLEANVDFRAGSGQAERDRAIHEMRESLGAKDPVVSESLQRQAFDAGSGHGELRLPRDAVLALAERAASLLLARAGR